MEKRLLDVPAAKFWEIVKLLEQVQERPEVRNTLATIRPRLTQVRPQRRPSLTRLMCLPFEDVLEGGGRNGSIGGVQRRVIIPVWRLVENDVDPKLMNLLQHNHAALDPTDSAGQHAIGRQLWRAAAEVLTRRLETPDTEDGQGLDATLRRDIESVVPFLDSAETIEELKTLLPEKPIAYLSATDIAVIERQVEISARRDPARPLTILLAVAGRLANPASLLQRLEDMDFGRLTRAQKPLIISRLGAMVVRNLEQRSHRLASDATLAARPGDAVSLAENLVDGLISAGSALDSAYDDSVTSRLQTVRGVVRGMIQSNVIDTAPARVLSAVLEIDVSAERSLQAEEHARALRRCTRIAAPLGLGGMVESALKMIEEELERGAATLIGDLERRGAPDAEVRQTRARLSGAIRMMELIGDRGRADALASRGGRLLEGLGTGAMVAP
ncbi:hypothetical protein N825_36430 [Skermanella stibiiresistens SB22]|uniref:Uncharacterized protein n=1 Tax=Skermanella stibiiresistens SB22 TaxID=1385369 RepID=W9H696_9PROT|nr:hypothetical protein N825_36430 [Skermanella stibiiresistens SB22]